MKLLALDTSSQAASVALVEDGRLLAEEFANIRTTHSQTILPMTQHLLATVGLALGQVDAFAVTCGPGSFTGLRIGLSAVKGMAFVLDRPCYPVSTLDCLAWNLAGWPGLVCPVMDARCQQVYTALFDGRTGGLSRCWEDQALSLEDWEAKLPAGIPIVLVGDGAQLCYNRVQQQGKPAVQLAPGNLLHQRASSAALCAWAAIGQRAAPRTAGELVPAYLRLPQAERERLARGTAN